MADGPLSLGAPAGFIEGYGPQLKVGKGDVSLPQVTYEDVPAEPTPLTPQAGPNPLQTLNQGGVSGLYEGINQGLANLRNKAGQTLQDVYAGGPARRAQQGPLGSLAGDTAAKLTNPVPGSIPQAGMMAAGPAIGALGMSPVATGLLNAGTNAVLGYAEGGLPGAAMGAAGGLVAGGIGQKIKQAGEMSDAAKALIDRGKYTESIVSPKVKAAYAGYEKNPSILASGDTLNKMKMAASDEIQGVFNRIAQNAPPNALFTVSGLTQQQLGKYAPNGIQAIPNQYIPGSLNVAVPFKDALKIVQSMKAAGEPGWQNAERELVNQADTILPKAYRGALNQYRKDQVGISSIKAVQDARELEGGINPTDYPGYAKTEGRLFGEKGNNPDLAKAGLYGIKAAALPGMSPWRVNAVANAVKAVLGGGKGGAPVVNDPLTAPNFFRQLLRPVGAAVQTTPGVPRLPLGIKEADDDQPR